MKDMMRNTGDPMTEEWDVLGAALARYYRRTSCVAVVACDLGVDPDDRPERQSPKQAWSWLAKNADRAKLVSYVKSDYPLFPADFERPTGSLARALCRVAVEQPKIIEIARGIIDVGRVDLSGSAFNIWFDIAREAAAQGSLSRLEAMVQDLP